jgi:hypothetical protein
MKNWLKKDFEYASLNNNSEHTFTVGHNNFSDWSDAEFQAILLPEIPIQKP